MIKILSKLGIEGNFLNLMKKIYKNVTANIIITCEKFETSPLRSGTRQGCPATPCFSALSWKT